MSYVVCGDLNINVKMGFIKIITGNELQVKNRTEKG